MFNFLIGFALTSLPSAETYLPTEPQPFYPRQCRHRDYRAQLAPPKTQGDTAFCFAYTSAELAHQRTMIDVSALDLAMAFYFSPTESLNKISEPELRQYLDTHPGLSQRLEADCYGEDVTISGPHPLFHHLEGGYESNTLLLANARGLCADKDLPSDGGMAHHQSLVQRLEADALAGKGNTSPVVDRITQRFRSPTADLFHSEWFLHVNAVCSHRPPPMPLVPVDFWLARNRREFEQRRRQGQLGESDQEQVLASLDYALDHGRIAALGIDLNTLIEQPDDEDGDHSVNVVGRRHHGGECQYLLRDSSGYECDELLRPIRARCQPREFWVNERELKLSLYAVTYLR